MNPVSLKKNLIAASVYIAAYEMLVDALVDQLRSFYTNSWSLEHGGILGPDYAEKVLSLDKKEVFACAKWFQNSGAITDDDIKIIREIILHRNIIAHDLPELLSSAEKAISLTHLRSILYLATKIDRWWIANVEVPTNSEFAHSPPTPAQLAESMSMRMVTMQLMIQVAEGNDEGLAEIYEGWKVGITKRTQQTQ